MTALIFPGQGSQEPGMGKEYFEELPFPLALDAESLNRTENAQLAVFTVSMAALAAWVKENGPPDCVAGFSLGECSALTAAGALSAEDGFKLVKKRGELMQKACEAGEGAMSALLGGTPPEPFEDGQDWAKPVNFNCPGQTVVAGTPRGVSVLEERCKASGGRVARLALSGAFHTHAMSAAAEKLQDFARTLHWKTPAVPIYTNLTGEILPPATDLPSHLAAHMQNPVLWQKSIENMAASGVTRFIEIGHGSSLKKLIKRISRTVEII